MYSLLDRFCSKFRLAIVLSGAFFLFNVSVALAEISLFTTNQAEWESMVSDIEVLETTKENVEKADEVTSLTGLNDYLGRILTFRDVNTRLSRGFVVETLQPGAGFTFNDTEGGIPAEGVQLALSVGDFNDYEDDDWQLSLLDGAAIRAFGIEIRHARFAPGESITLYAGAEPVGIVDLSSLPSEGNETYFLGIVSDVPFDRIGFNEDPDGDDIAIADFRFGKITAAEICSTLGNNKHRRFPDLDKFKFAGKKGEEVTVYLDRAPSGTSTGDRVTLILTDHIRHVAFFDIERNKIPSEITAVLPATGIYHIFVVEQPGFWRSKSFRGDYCLTLESSGGASETLESTDRGE